MNAPRCFRRPGESGEGMRGGVRKMGDDAIATMRKRGLTVTHADPSIVSEWRREAEAVYPRLRGQTIPAELFDEVRKLRDEFRRANGGAK